MAPLLANVGVDLDSNCALESNPFYLRHFSRLSYAEIDAVSRKIQGTSVPPRRSG
jgi:hypothetical protein